MTRKVMAENVKKARRGLILLIATGLGCVSGGFQPSLLHAGQQWRCV